MKFLRNIFVLGMIGFIAWVQFYRIEGIEGLKVLPRGEGPSMIDDLRAMLNRPQPSDGIGQLSSLRTEPLIFPASEQAELAGTHNLPTSIRLGTFNLHQFSRRKIGDSDVMGRLVGLLREMDVIAVQEIDADRRDLLPKLVEQLNRSGRRFDYLAGPKIGPIGFEQRLAFVFDRDRVEADRSQTYTMSDPADQMAYEPLVAWFRTIGVPPSSAWTFSMANVYFDPDNAQREQALLSTIYQSIQSDGRGEDDIILAGCFWVGSRTSAARPESLLFAARRTPTDIYARRQTANIAFSRHATTEFRGDCGTIDFLRQHNMTIAEAESISEYLPVWADFQVSEDQQIL
ncbi:MAG: endonuclease/exonuclease/phosphatase [Pirellulaceae bacterium]